MDREHIWVGPSCIPCKILADMANYFFDQLKYDNITLV